MPVTSITMPRYSARSPGGTDFAPAAGHDADRGGADRDGRTGWMAHAVGRPEGPEDTWLPGRGGRVRHGEPVSRIGCDSRSARPRAVRGQSSPVHRSGCRSRPRLLEHEAPDRATGPGVPDRVAHRFG